MSNSSEDLVRNLEGLHKALAGLSRLLVGNRQAETARAQIEWSASHLFMAIRELRGDVGPIVSERRLPSEPKHGRLMEGLRGHTRAITIPEVLGFVASLRKSGVLRINSPEEAFLIQLEEGAVVYAQGDNPPSGALLGEILAGQGALTKEALEHACEQFGEDSEMLGQRLLDHDLVQPDALRIALAFQVQLLMNRVFHAEDALFQFDEGQVLRNPGDIRLNVTSLLLESARTSDESRNESALRRSA